MTRRAGRRSQRTPALLAALVLTAVTGWTALRAEVPYVTFSPGPTVNVLGESGEDPIIEVEGRESFRDDGALRLVTVIPSGPQQKVDLFSLVRAWVDPAVNVYPYASIYGPQDTRSSVRQESAAQMTSSKDNAVAAALGAMDIDFQRGVGVSAVDPEGPAVDELEAGDQVESLDGRPVTSVDDLVQRVSSQPVGTEVTFEVLRGGDTVTEQVTTVASPEGEGSAVRIGVSECCFEFPFDVSLNISENIGGPSAGLMFALGIYDILTPGSLTDAKTIAGTGTIDPEGRVGAIGGIQQKLVGAQNDGAELFLVPAENCAEALGGDYDPEELRLVRTETLSAAIEHVEAWVEDPDAELPGCEA
jgi:PDZ domain-containing protein